MDAQAYEMMARDEDRHWWWSGRRAILHALIADQRDRASLPRGTLYDLGCGVGSNLPVLDAFGPAVGFDGSDLAVAAAHRLGRTGVRFADLAHGVEALDSVQPGSGSLVLLADVLEHLDDEEPALKLADHLLGPGGVLIVTVPAFPALWSAADEFNHHRRRYTRDTLRAAVERVFDVERLSYFNFWLFAPIVAARALGKLTGRPGKDEIALPPTAVNRALAALFSSESALLTRTDLPVGVSLLCVARKRARP